MSVLKLVSVPAANADGATPPRASATTARATRRLCCVKNCMGTPTLSKKKSVQDGAEARNRRGTRLQWVLEHPADVAVFIGARLARGTVVGDGEILGCAEGHA